MAQVGFLYPLNYPFVVANPMSSAQIFQFLPQGLADGLGLSSDQVQMHSLVPWDSSASVGYITTLAWFYVPTSEIDSLAMAIRTPKSALYTNTDGSINTLMSYINPTLSIVPGAQSEESTTSGSTGSGSGSSSSSSNKNSGSDNGGVFTTNQQTTTASQTGKTAGIAVGALGAAAAYGAAMFYIARRYKRKKTSHRRASSLVNPSEMRYTSSPALMGAAVMSGGRGSYGTAQNGRDSRGSGNTGRTARQAGISAPMMVENSLGWN